MASMFTLDGIRQLHRWTHLCLDRAFDHIATIPIADYTRDVPGFGSPNLRAQVIHCINCEAFWIHVLQGQPYTDEDPSRFPTVADAGAFESRVSAQTLDYLSRLTDPQLNTNATLHFPDGDTAVRTPALILHHMLTHAFHHKGQIAAMCRLLGHPAPDTDLNNFE
ncbi:MAG TPA: DinB family protein [Acidobacteriaceae bacterium]